MTLQSGQAVQLAIYSCMDLNQIWCLDIGISDGKCQMVRLCSTLGRWLPPPLAIAPARMDHIYMIEIVAISCMQPLVRI